MIRIILMFSRMSATIRYYIAALAVLCGVAAPCVLAAPAHALPVGPSLDTLRSLSSANMPVSSAATAESLVGAATHYPGSSFSLRYTGMVYVRAGFERGMFTTAAVPQDQSFSRQASSRLKSSWTWYIARASGLAAAALLVLLMFSGIGLVTGFTFRLFEPLTAWAVHRAMGLALLGSVGVHMLVLLLDTYVPFDLVDLFVPFLSSNKSFPDQTQWRIGVGLGVLATYATVVVVASSLLWINTRAHTWKLLHYTSYALMAAVFVHGLYVGTDMSKGWVRIAWIAIGVLLMGGIVTRLMRARTISGGKK